MFINLCGNETSSLSGIYSFLPYKEEKKSLLGSFWLPLKTKCSLGHKSYHSECKTQTHLIFISGLISSRAIRALVLFLWSNSSSCISPGSKAIDYSNGLFDCQSPTSPFLGGLRVLHLLEDLRAALELMDNEERDNLRCQIPDSTAEGLAEWLQGGMVKEKTGGGNCKVELETWPM